jgi:hypothetical protein
MREARRRAVYKRMDTSPCRARRSCRHSTIKRRSASVRSETHFRRHPRSSEAGARRVPQIVPRCADHLARCRKGGPPCRYGTIAPRGYVPRDAADEPLCHPDDVDDDPKRYEASPARSFIRMHLTSPTAHTVQAPAAHYSRCEISRNEQ